MGDPTTPCRRCKQRVANKLYPRDSRGRRSDKCADCQPLAIGLRNGYSEEAVRRMCLSKKGYPDADAALRAKVGNARIFAGAPMRSYHCPLCDCFHTSTKERSAAF